MAAEHDPSVLRFIAGQEVAIKAQLEALLEADPGGVDGELETLIGQGLIAGARFLDGFPALYRVTPAGQAKVNERLRPLAEPSPAGLRHQVAAGWVYVAAVQGAFGPDQRPVSRREMVAAQAGGEVGDLVNGFDAESFAVTLSSSGETVYPDVVCVLGSRGWLAIHVLLSAPDIGSWRPLLAAYAAQDSVRAMLVLVPDQPARDALEQVWTELKVPVGEKEPATGKLAVRLLTASGVPLGEGHNI